MNTDTQQSVSVALAGQTRGKRELVYPEPHEGSLNFLVTFSFKRKSDKQTIFIQIYSSKNSKPGKVTLGKEALQDHLV